MTSPLLFEILTLALLLASGVSGAFLLGARSALQAIPLGLGLAVMWRVLSHSVIYFIGFGEHSRLVWIVGAIALIAAATFKHFRLSGYWLSVGLGAIAAAMAAVLTRGFGLRGIPHSDSLWILTLSDLMQRSGDLEIVGGRTAIKRGFAYPMTLALGPEGSSLTGLTPLIYIALVLAIIWAIISLSPPLDAKQWAWILVPLVLVLITTPILLRAVWYVNGHTLTALGVTLAVTAVVLAVRDGTLTRLNLAVIMIGLALISTTRPEGVAFAALIAAPLISERWISRWDVRWIVFSALGSFGLWMYLCDGYIPNELRLYDERFPIAMLISSFLVGLKLFDWFRFRLVPLALIGMTAILVFMFATNFVTLTDDVWLQVQNMFFGEGFWGGFFIAMVIGAVVLGLRKLDSNYRLLALISVLLVIGSIVAKLMDGGLFGDPTLGRLGWTDSLNRMWLHSFGIFIITLVIGFAQSVSQKAKVSA